MIIKSKYIELNIDPLLLAVLPVMYMVGYFYKFLAIFLAIFLHELAHMISAQLSGKKVYSVRILPIGLNATFDEITCDRKTRIIIYLSGPLVNLFIFLAGNLILSYYLDYSDNMYFFVWINIYIAVFNLLPVIPLDGGRLLREVLSYRFGFFLAAKYIRKIALVFSVLLIIAGIFQFAGKFHNFSLILIGCYIFFTLKNQEMEAALMNIKDVIYRRSRLLKKGVYPVRVLAVLKTTHLGEVLKCMDFDRFHIIHVLDDELKVLKEYTENEIIEGILKHNVELTFEDFMKTKK